MIIVYQFLLCVTAKVLFKNHTYDINANNKISIILSEGFLLQEILPTGLNDTLDQRVATPLRENCLASKTFNDHYKTMFNNSHLQLIHSTYFDHDSQQQLSNYKKVWRKFNSCIVPRIKCRLWALFWSIKVLWKPVRNMLTLNPKGAKLIVLLIQQRYKSVD